MRTRTLPSSGAIAQAAPAFAAFFLSGASSLIFQTIWTRMLHHVFGATSVAISTVLTVFMAGLGLGAWLGGKYAARIRHPIITYAVAEIGVGVWGLLVPFLVRQDGWLAEVNSFLRESLGADSSTFMIARFICVVPILLVPTTLMGSTLPLLTRHFVARRHGADAAGSRVGVLYALNTFGAATGPILSAFVLMPTVGLTVTNIVACSMNFALAALIFGFRRPLLKGTWEPGEPLRFLPDPKGPAVEGEGPPVEESADPKALPDSEAAVSKEADEPEAAVERLDAKEATEPKASDKPGAKPRKKARRPKRGTEDASAREARASEGEESAEGDTPKPRKPKKKEPKATPVADVVASPVIPPMARKVALFAFAASGAAALCYEVVWSRALAMTIGSSIYSFALILETFLIGIAAGSAAMSAFLGRKRSPLIGIAITAGVLVLLSNTPWAIDMIDDGRRLQGSFAAFFGLSLLFIGGIAVVGVGAYLKARAADAIGDSEGGVVIPGIAMLAIPLLAASITLARFPGYLPKIIFSVTAAIVTFLLICLAFRRAPVLLLALIQLFIAGATIVSYVWQDEIPYAFAQLVTSIPSSQLPDHVGTVQFFMFLTASLCTLPATLGMGAMFPLTVRIWTAGGEGVARDVGVVYTSNTVGSIIGAWLPGFVLMPWIGMERTLHVGIWLNMGLALLVLIAGAAEDDPAESDTAAGKKGKQGKKGREKMAAPTGRTPVWQTATIYILSPLIPALAALLFLFTKHPHSASPDAPWSLRWNLTQMTLGVFRVSLAEGMLDTDSWGQPDLVYYRDGISTTVSVERWGRHIAMKNNGKVDASNGDDMPTQINVSAYPLLLHPSGPTDLDVAVIGFGSGVSVGTALKFPVRHVDVIELEPAIIEAARFFIDYNHLDYTRTDWPYVEMDRLTIWGDDGRNFLAASRREYDVIISEPSNPWITGVSDLFTVDHFRITKRRLRPGGIYCQWVQLYELSPENIKTIYRTFASQFDHVLVLSADDRSSDTVVLGSDQPISLDLERVRRAFDLPGVEAEMARGNVFSPFDVFARTLLASRDEVMAYTRIEERLRGGVWEAQADSNNAGDCPEERCRRIPAILNTDDNARIEFAAPRDLIGFARYERYLSTIYAQEWPYGHPRAALANFGEGDDAARAYAELAMSLIAHGRYAWAGDFIETSQRAGSARETAVALEVLTHILTSDHEPAVRIEPPIPGPEMDSQTARTLNEGFDRVREAVDERAYGAALLAMENIPSPLRLHSGPSMRFLYGYLLYQAADGSYAQYRAAIEQLEDLTRADADYVARRPEIHYFLAKAQDAVGDYGGALRAMRTYVESRLGESQAEDIAEPPPGQAPTTDAPGESPKEAHPDRL